MELSDAVRYLKTRQGPNVNIMEVCGTHTAAIMQSGLRSLLPENVRLISGPGCPVCVTPAAYIDKAVEWAFTPHAHLYAFGDMMKVRGTGMSLSEAKARGGAVTFVYSPLDLLDRAAQEADTLHVFAAVGFETTAPAYALLLERAEALHLQNIRLLTAIRLVPPALRMILENESHIHAFLAPGHVSAIIGARAYRPLAAEFGKPFAIAGFTPQHILAAVVHLLEDLRRGTSEVTNLYPAVVSEEGNVLAQEATSRWFIAGDAQWRGLGLMKDSGLYLRPEHVSRDAGSFGLDAEGSHHPACRCADVILGRISPPDCPLFGRLCTPMHAEGPCMVSTEGACGIWHRFSGSQG